MNKIPNIELTSQQVAALFNVTTMTVYLWVRDRGLPTVRRPRGTRQSVRYLLPAALAWARKAGKVADQDQLQRLLAQAGR